jgi:hypothetical protein
VLAAVVPEDLLKACSQRDDRPERLPGPPPLAHRQRVGVAAMVEPTPTPGVAVVELLPAALRARAAALPAVTSA